MIWEEADPDDVRILDRIRRGMMLYHVSPLALDKDNFFQGQGPFAGHHVSVLYYWHESGQDDSMRAADGRIIVPITDEERAFFQFPETYCYAVLKDNGSGRFEDIEFLEFPP